MHKAFELLRIIQERFPAAPGCAHNLVWHEGKPCLMLMLPGQWQRVGLDPPDFDRKPKAVADDVGVYLRSLAVG